MPACSFCGEPVERPETHHDDHTKDDTDPDNLRTAHRRCHMHHHGNDRATDGDASLKYGPKGVGSTGPNRPNTSPPTP